MSILAMGSEKSVSQISTAPIFFVCVCGGGGGGACGGREAGEKIICWNAGSTL